jgi:hypothetical protein
MNWIIWTIIICEIGFWVVILAGLVSRYLLKKEKLGLFFLALTPLVDLILLIATGLDLYNGAIANIAHGLAAVYIGVSLAYGKGMIQWADKRFQYYYLKQGDKPIKKYGLEFALQNIKGWGKHVFAYLVGIALLGTVVYFVNDASRTEALLTVIKVWSLVLGIDLLISISYFLWPRKPSSTSKSML